MQPREFVCALALPFGETKKTVFHAVTMERARALFANLRSPSEPEDPPFEVDLPFSITSAGHNGASLALSGGRGAYLRTILPVSDKHFSEHRGVLIDVRSTQIQALAYRTLLSLVHL